MKIALAQFNPTIGDFEGNSKRILEMAREAKSHGAELAVFSELCLCGYPPQDLVERPVFVEHNQKALAKLAKAIAMPAVVGFVGDGHARGLVYQNKKHTLRRGVIDQTESGSRERQECKKISE